MDFETFAALQRRVLGQEPLVFDVAGSRVAMAQPTNRRGKNAVFIVRIGVVAVTCSRSEAGE